MSSQTLEKALVLPEIKFQKYTGANQRLLNAILVSILIHLAIFGYFTWNPSWNVAPKNTVILPTLDISLIELFEKPEIVQTHVPKKIVAPTIAPVLKKSSLPTAAIKPEPTTNAVVKPEKANNQPATKEMSQASEPSEDQLGIAADRQQSGKISNVVRASYESLLASWLQRYRAYPSRALRRRLTGEGVLYVKIDRAGHVLDYKLSKSTNHDILDEAILSMLRKAEPLPEIPGTFKVNQYEFAVPVAFEIS